MSKILLQVPKLSSVTSLPIVKEARSSTNYDFEFFSKFLRFGETESPEYDLYRKLWLSFTDLRSGNYISVKRNLISLNKKRKSTRINGVLRNIADVITEIGLTQSQVDKLLNTKKNLSIWLKRNKIVGKIELDKFMDAENSEWIEIKLIIRIKNFESEYSKVKEKTYDFFDKFFDDTLYNKVMLKVEPWN